MKRIRLARVFQIALLIMLSGQCDFIECQGQDINPMMQYTISMPDPANHFFHIDLICKNMNRDTIDYKMPQRMPGYYQIMNYSGEVKIFLQASSMARLSLLLNQPIIPGELCQKSNKQNPVFFHINITFCFV